MKADLKLGVWGWVNLSRLALLLVFFLFRNRGNTFQQESDDHADWPEAAWELYRPLLSVGCLLLSVIPIALWVGFCSTIRPVPLPVAIGLTFLVL